MALSDFLYTAFHKPSTRAYQVVDATVYVLIVLSLVTLGLEPFAVGKWKPLLQRLDQILLVLFALEVTIRILTFRPPILDVFEHSPAQALRVNVLERLRFASRPGMLIDIVTVLALVPQLRGLRVLRLLRLLRSPRLFRYGNPFESVVRAFERDKLLFVFALSVLAIEVILGGFSIFFIEYGYPDSKIQTLADGMWWAIVTLTTVGFGDFFPVSPLGRTFASVLMVGGMFTLALFAGVVGHSLLNAVLSIRAEQFRMSGYVDHIVVCGYEVGASTLLAALTTQVDTDKTAVVLIGDSERPPDLPPEFLWVRGEPTKESELDKVRMTYARAVILAATRSVAPQHADATSILAAFTIRSYLKKQTRATDRHRPVHIVAEILDPENVTHARSAGADEVIQSRYVGDSLIAHSVVAPGVADITSSVVLAGNQDLFSGELPETIELPKPFGEVLMQIKDATGALIIGLHDPETGDDIINPANDTIVNPGLRVIYMSPQSCLKET